MVNVLSIEVLADLIKRHTLTQFILDLMQEIRGDYGRWQAFYKMLKPQLNHQNNTLEIESIADQEFFAHKYINTQVNSTLTNMPTCIATGQLSQVQNGTPIFISEMTTLSALRSAATSALASDLLSNMDAKNIAIIGTGAQSEFQILSHCLIRDVETVKYYDTDSAAMIRFYRNMKNYHFKLIPGESLEDTVIDADIIIITTSDNGSIQPQLMQNWIKPGAHINSFGVKKFGQTALDPQLISSSKYVVEHKGQSELEGEIQNFHQNEKDLLIYAELWELINGLKPLRENNTEITIFDTINYVLGDFSVLKFTHKLCEKYQMGRVMNLVPPLANPKNLFSVLNLSHDASLETTFFGNSH
ncbi:ornithine cyclodeaminase [Francisellaceae bacterium]|nr:ornithine cyclodeaminase [Francisellaceae bacterium]